MMPPEIFGNKGKQQFEAELQDNILPFWMANSPDRENGGFFGAVTNDRIAQNQVERSAVLCGRLLWTFSTAAKMYPDASYLKAADWFFDYLSTRFWDPQYQGVYWSIDKHGRPIQDRKHTYAMAFSIYGLAAYYQVSGSDKSLVLARQLFERIERHTFDAVHGGNVECRARDWASLADMRLSEIDINSSKSMNTLLHLMESYTALVKIWPDKYLTEKLDGLLRIFLTQIIDINSGHQRLYFDEEWNSLSDHVSYGHDIETSWLIMETAETLGDAALIVQARESSLKLAQTVYDESLGEDGSILYETGPHGVQVLTRHWWAHAEAVVGFYNAYQLSGKAHFARASRNVWNYIQRHFIDYKDGDWFKLLEQDGTPITTHYKVGPWDCPYHHARMCFEMIKRLEMV